MDMGIQHGHKEGQEQGHGRTYCRLDTDMAIDMDTFEMQIVDIEYRIAPKLDKSDIGIKTSMSTSFPFRCCEVCSPIVHCDVR
jgi:hypothetical protein